MCFDLDSQPPIPEGDREVTGSDITLAAGDGNEFMAYEVVGADASAAAVVVLPDVRGLFDFYKVLALRFAQAGHDSIAIDYFGRTEGMGARPNDWDFRPHVDATTLDGIKADTAAAVAKLREANPERRIFTVGFCFGGSNSWHQAASGHGLAGAVGFYGRPRRDGDEIDVMDRIDEIACPILALMGGADPGIPQEVVDEFEAALNAARKPNEVVTYPGAPHSFFDRKYAEFGDASLDAWERILGFIAANS